MMRYRDPTATWLGSPNFSPGRPDGILWIVLHTMVGTVASANARFQNPDQLASAHYGIGLDGSQVQWVDEGDTAWHAGDFDVNQRSIGIEHEDGGDYNGIRPDALYNASSVLVAAICSRYGIPAQRGDYAAGVPGCIDHRTVYATGCPDALDTDRIIRGSQRFGPGGATIGGGKRKMFTTVDSTGTGYLFTGEVLLTIQSGADLAGLEAAGIQRAKLSDGFIKTLKALPQPSGGGGTVTFPKGLSGTFTGTLT